MIPVALLVKMPLSAVIFEIWSPGQKMKNIFLS